MRAIAAGANPTPQNALVVDYELVSRGTEPVWMSTGGGGRGGGRGGGGQAAGGQPGGRGQAPDQAAGPAYTLQDVPVWLKYEPTRTIPRARGYVIPASIAKVVPLLLDHGIQVHQFREPATLELEVYEATGVQRNEFFQGHYLKSVTGVEKKTEKVEVPAGWFYVSTAQSKGNLVSYIMEPETDDNLITWGYTDNVLRVTPNSVEDAMRGLLDDTDPSALTPAQRTQMEERAANMMKQRQRVPMMRLVTEQPKPLIEVVRFTELNRTRYSNR
jgi:hypothetical protein